MDISENIGTPSVPSVTFEKSSIDDIPVVTEFVEAELEKADCPMKTVIQISVAIDEIYSNIVRYGYRDKPGPVTVRVVHKNDPNGVEIVFEDEGVKYDPLQKDDPDITLSAEERDIGGLGIFMVKKTMDDVRYAFEDGKNILTLEKHI